MAFSSGKPTQPASSGVSQPLQKLRCRPWRLASAASSRARKKNRRRAAPLVRRRVRAAAVDDLAGIDQTAARRHLGLEGLVRPRLGPEVAPAVAPGRDARRARLGLEVRDGEHARHGDGDALRPVAEVAPVLGVAVEPLRPGPGADAHHLARVHPILRAVRQELGVGDAQEQRMHEDAIQERPRPRGEAREPLRVAAPELGHVRVVGRGAGRRRAEGRLRLVPQLRQRLRRQHVLDDDGAVALVGRPDVVERRRRWEPSQRRFFRGPAQASTQRADGGGAGDGPRRGFERVDHSHTRSTLPRLAV